MILSKIKEEIFNNQQDFAHDVDLIIEVENGMDKANGRFGVGEEKVKRILLKKSEINSIIIYF